jgi:hypothetical protein
VKIQAKPMESSSLRALSWTCSAISRNAASMLDWRRQAIAILFTGRPGSIELDGWLLVNHSGQHRFATLAALEQARSAEESARAP